MVPQSTQRQTGQEVILARSSSVLGRQAGGSRYQLAQADYVPHSGA